jgi:hypothetical protein
MENLWRFSRFNCKKVTGFDLKIALTKESKNFNCYFWVFCRCRSREPNRNNSMEWEWSDLPGGVGVPGAGTHVGGVGVNYG